MIKKKQNKKDLLQEDYKVCTCINTSLHTELKVFDMPLSYKSIGKVIYFIPI